MRAPLVALAVLLALATPAGANQSTLPTDTTVIDPVLTFDWPAISVGIGSYEAGPTGVTVIRFNQRASLAVDTRGGAPGTVNTDALRLGYETPFTDAVVFAGGSAYGEEAITAVATGLKDADIRSGDRSNVAFVPGAIIFDFAGRRLNEIYPDKRLAQAALAAAKPGVFPLGAQGAGRMAMQGGFFGCGAHSGQGAAFRQIGAVKIAAFVVVNASGSITDRDGTLVRCHRAPGWAGLTKTTDLLQHLPASVRPDWTAAPGPTQNTTVSLIVTNRKLGFAALQRLAVQVHMSMGRAIQPFSTIDDGDTLFAASTQEIADASVSTEMLSTIASEVMWDAILASVPADDPPPQPVSSVTISPETLAAYTGTYDFAGPLPVPTAFAGLGLELRPQPGGVLLTPSPNGPAARAGVQPGDLMTALDGTTLAGLSLDEVIRRARGQAGTSATLTLSRPNADQPIELTITRQPFRLRPLLRVTARDGALWAEAVGGRALFEFRIGQPVKLIAISDTEFTIPGRYGTSLAFTMTGSHVAGAMLNPGRWQQRGVKLEPPSSP